MLSTINITIPPYASAVHLNEMKSHLRVDLTDDDGLIAQLTAAASDYAETGTSANSERMRVMVATTFAMTMADFPASGTICVPRVPLVSVTSITYVDSDGATQTLSSSSYAVRGDQIHLAYGQTWPTTRGGDEDRITVTFIAGMVAQFTAATSDVLTVFGRSFTTGDRVRLMNSGGALPGTLKPLTDYFLIAGPKLSLTSGGSAVDVQSSGSGTHFISSDLSAFETMRAAIKLMVGHWYEHREAVGETMTPLPMAVDSLLRSAHA